MKKEHLVSIIMGTYNESINELSNAIDSILNQSYKNIEFIIVLDNPENEAIKTCVYEYQKIDNRIIVIENKINKGLAQSLNIGISHAKAKFIARMDADDVSLESRIEKQLHYMLKRNLDVLGTNRIDIDESGNVIDEGKSVVTNSEEIKHSLLYGSVLTHPSVMLKKSVFMKVGGYRDFPCSQDYDLWLRLSLLDCKFSNLEEKLIMYRIRSTSISNKNKFKQYITSQYQLLLLEERKLMGTDSFNKENYEFYLRKAGCYNEKRTQKFNKAIGIFNEGTNNLKRNRVAIGLYNYLRASILDLHVAKIVLNSIKFQISKKRNDSKLLK